VSAIRAETLAHRDKEQRTERASWTARFRAQAMAVAAIQGRR
jgi:hypothetical protein